MRKEGFNMYITKEKSNNNLYKSYKPQVSKHQDMEIQVYVAGKISSSISESMRSTVSRMSTMIVHGVIGRK